MMHVARLVTLDAALLTELAVLELTAWNSQPEPQRIEERKKRMMDEFASLRHDTQAIFVARENTITLGIGRISAWDNASGKWMLHGIAVRPDRQRRGVGTAIALQCIEFARCHGARVILSSTHTDNHRSIAFHPTVGFENRGSHTAPDGDELIDFSLRLGNHVE